MAFLDRTTISPERVYLKDCRCGGMPQVFRAEKQDNTDAWAFVCPDCGFQIVGRRSEGLALDGVDLVDVTKPGDDFDMMVTMWNADDVKVAA